MKKHTDALASGCRHNAELWARAVSLLGSASAWLTISDATDNQKRAGYDIDRFLASEAKTWDHLEVEE